MKISISNEKVQKDFEKVRIYHWLHFSFLTLALLLQIFHEFATLWNLFTIFVLVFFYRYYFKTIKQVLYTFWTFSFFLMIYFTVGLVKSFFIYEGLGLISAHLLAILFLVLEMYILSSPLFFPRVKWWEYDFRFRHELTVKIMSNNNEYRGRLSDLRRDAGCLVSFEDFELGKEVNVQLAEKYGSLLLRAEIVSKRDYSIGRPYNYGVIITFGSRAEKNIYSEFLEKWEKEGNFKAKIKLKTVESEKQNA